MAVENCENCGRVIGKLEQPHVWRKHVVCAACHAHLSSQASSAGTRVGPAASLPRPEHYHARAPAPVHHEGPPPAPLNIRPERVAPEAPPMFLCGTCGRSFGVAEVSTENGRIICRSCAAAAAEKRAAIRRAEARDATMKTVVIAAAVLLVIGAGVAVTYVVMQSRPRAPVAKADEEVLEAAEAKPARVSGAAPVAEAPVADESATPAGKRPAPSAPADTLFPEATASGTPGSGAAASAAPADLPVKIEAPAVAPEEPAPTVVAQGNGPGAPALVATGGTGPAPAPAAPNPATAPASKPAPPPEGTAAFFVYQGKYRPASEQFTAALKLDRNSADAHHGLGLCLTNMGDRVGGLGRLESAVKLYEPPNRAAIYNCAVANLRDNPMRAAKLCKDYLSLPGVLPDEPMHDVMGKALFSVSRQASQNRFYSECEEFYYGYNATLEQARGDGRKRWGSEWVSAGEATNKWYQYKTRRDNVIRMRSAMDHAKKNTKDTHNKVFEYGSDMKLHSEMELKTARRNYEMAAKAERETSIQLNQAEAEYRSAEKPPVPQIVKFVAMDAQPPTLDPASRAAQIQNGVQGQPGQQAPLFR